MTECANCGNERIMLCPFCEHDFSELSKNNEAELRQLRREVALLRQVERSAKEAVYYIAGPMEQAIQIKQELSDALKALEKHHAPQRSQLAEHPNPHDTGQGDP